MNFLSMVLAAMLAATPSMNIQAAVTADSTTTTKTFVVTTNSDTKKNGRSITQQEKDVAKEMARHGGKMGRKAAQIAVAAVTNPSKAKQLEDELQNMADKMERLGDSLNALSEDTTFFYDGDDCEADTVALSEDDLDELKDEFEESFGVHWNWPLTWWGKLFAGSLGIMGGMIGILVALIVIVFLFLLFTAPLWIIALIIWAIARNNRRDSTTPLQQTSFSTGLNSDGTQQPHTATAAASTSASSAVPVSTPIQSYRDENLEMFKSGIMYGCVGLGLILLFVSIGLEDLWGIGALVACIGVAKIIISKFSKNKQRTQDTTSRQETILTVSGDEDKPYNKNEN